MIVSGEKRIKKKRQSNIELLRILAMILIVAHHFAVHGDFSFSEVTVEFNKIWVQFLQMGGKIGVNIFVLISGFFLVKAQRIRLNKVLKFWFQVFTYSIILYLIFIFLGIIQFDSLELIKRIFPIIFSRWWFASTYFVLYILSPYFNCLLNSFNKNQYQAFLLLLTVIWSIIPTLTTMPFQSNALIWFFYLYALSGYIRLHYPLENIDVKRYIVFILFLLSLTFLTAVIFDYIGLVIPSFAQHSTYFFEMQKLPIVLISILIFLLFLKIDIGSQKIINVVSSATFGVYLIHDNTFVRDFLWITFFKNASFAQSIYLIPYSILVIILVYSVCTLIELMRIYLIEKQYMPYLIRVSNTFEKGLIKIKDFICRYL